MIAALAVVGCGDDNEDGGGSTGSGAPNAGKQFEGEPVKLYFLGPLESPLTDFTDVVSAIEVSVQRINDNGGLQGREVQLETCNDTTANDELSCARQAIDDGALAFVGSLALFNSGAFGTALEEAGMANVAPLLIQQESFAQPTAFPLYTPSYGVLTCPQLMTEAAGSKRFSAITQEIPAQKELLTVIDALSKATGFDYGTGVAVPQQQTDFSAAVKELEDSGADTVINILAPPTQPAFFQAINGVGAEFTHCGSTNTYNYEVLSQLGEAADNIHVSMGLTPTVPADTDVPLLMEFYDEMKAKAEAGDDAADPDKLASPDALNAWLGMKVLEQAAGDVQGELTTESFLKAMSATKIEFEDVLPALDFSKPPAGPLPRLFNPMVSLYKWSSSADGFEPVDGAEPASTLEALGALAG